MMREVLALAVVAKAAKISSMVNSCGTRGHHTDKSFNTFNWHMYTNLTGFTGSWDLRSWCCYEESLVYQ